MGKLTAERESTGPGGANQRRDLKRGEVRDARTHETLQKAQKNKFPTKNELINKPQQEEKRRRARDRM